VDTSGDSYGSGMASLPGLFSADVDCVARTLKPYDRLVDPIVVMRRIGFGLLTTDRSLDQTLFAPIHHFTDRLGFSQISVTALSMMWR
jgi:hypothetical protein